MPIKIAQHPTKPYQVKFYPESHKYIMNDETELRSVSEVIADFFPNFDFANVSKEYAAKHNIPLDDVRRMWNQERDKAIDFGNAVHKYIEYKLMNKDTSEIEGIDEETRNNIDNFIRFLSGSYQIVSAEFIVFSPEYKVAGTIDALFQSKENPKSYLLIDWKTCKKIDYQSTYSYSELLELYNNGFTLYSLQLNFYRWLLVHEGYVDSEDVNMCIVHIRPNQAPTVYGVPPLQSYIAKMLSYLSITTQKT